MLKVMLGNDTTDQETRWIARALAQPIPPVPAETSCADVYAMMERDEALFAVPIIAAEARFGLAGRISLMSQFARPYWRELFAHRPITKLMDPAPLVVDASLEIEAISLLIATEKTTALNAGFIITENGRYLGTANSVDLLRLSADHAHQRAHELGVAHREIHTLNSDLERRVNERTAELRAAQDALLSKERLSTLGQLTATVAHELRNPLSSIRNTLFTLKDMLARVGENCERPVARMERSIARCDGIISDLLDYTRARDLRCRAVTADKWLEETLDEQSVPADVTVIRRFGAPGCRISVDTEKMRRVLVNLIDNAVQAMAEADAAITARVITITTSEPRKAYELAIEDTGPGIPAEIMPKIFEPLFSTKNFGTGLGLPTVKQIIEQHGGRIVIDSEIGQGTRVVIRLPNAAAKEMAA